MLNIEERKLIVRLHQQGKTQGQIAGILSCSQPTVHRWVTNHKRGRTLNNLHRSGHPTNLTKQRLATVKQKIQTEILDKNEKFCSISTKQVRELIAAEVGKVYSLRHIERLMHKLGFILITPRPQHILHDKEGVEAIRKDVKKKSPKSMWVMSS